MKKSKPSITSVSCQTQGTNSFEILILNVSNSLPVITFGSYAGDFVLEVVAPSDSNGALVQLGALYVQHYGEAVPCVDLTKTPVYSSTDPTSTDIYFNKARLEIGELKKE